MLFKLEDKTPEIYTEKSRDFQLLCRIINIYLNYIIQRSDSLLSASNVDTMQDNLLPLFARRLGFTTDKYFPPEILRNICKNYPNMIKHKGTTLAIELAAKSTLTASKEVTTIKVDIKPKTDGNNNIIVSIVSDASNKNLQYLKELLTFILPTGVSVEYYLNLTKNISLNTYLNIPNTIKIIKGEGKPISGIISNTPLTFEDILDKESEGFWSRISMARIIKSEPKANSITAKEFEG